jgi:hypothetical protein
MDGRVPTKTTKTGTTRTSREHGIAETREALEKPWQRLQAAPVFTELLHYWRAVASKLGIAVTQQ